MNNAKNILEMSEFKLLLDSILENENKIHVFFQNRRDLFKLVLKECNYLFEDVLYKWAKNNPIEALAYIQADLLLGEDIYFKNEHGYEELFGEETCRYTENTIYTLYDKNTLSGVSFYEYEIKEYFCNLKNKSNTSFTLGFLNDYGYESLKLDFLNDYKINLIKYNIDSNENAKWILDIKVDESIIPKEYIIKFLDKNFTLAVSSSED